MRIADIAPDFTAETTHGPISFHSWLGDDWGILFSHPKDFTPVCTTELGYMAKLKPEFDKRGVKVIGLSVDAVDRHAGWAKDIEETQGLAPNFPMIGDPTLAISKLYDMLPAAADGDAAKRTAADNQTVRNVYVIGPDKKIKLVIAYPMTTGRNFDEVLRVVDSLQLTAKHRLATPVNWQPGQEVIIAGSVSNDEAKAMFPGGWKQPKPYLRIVPQPGAGRVHYRHDGIASYDAPIDKVLQYMSAGGHPHVAFKRHELVSRAGDLVTIAAEVFNPDGSTSSMTIEHTIGADRVSTVMKGGPFDGARFAQTYTSVGGRTRGDLEGDFPAMPGMSADEELKMIDGFFTMVLGEDQVTLRTWSPKGPSKGKVQ
jgi:alkyl hydroperoxide reductase subunit AhpC